eukprot:gene17520-12534_t
MPGTNVLRVHGATVGCHGRCELNEFFMLPETKWVSRGTDHGISGWMISESRQRCLRKLGHDKRKNLQLFLIRQEAVVEQRPRGLSRLGFENLRLALLGEAFDQFIELFENTVDGIETFRQ